MGMFKTEKLARRCQQSIESFGKEIPVFGNQIKKGERLYWKDNGSKILAVAHLDSVQKHSTTKVKRDGHIVRAGTLDDRLGVHIILDILPMLNINVDILLTEGEESGRSTAQFFTDEKGEAPKKYNWVVEFDRSGCDVVMYEFEDEDLRARLKESGFELGVGSFTDICWLEHLGCKAFNVGVGYYDYHSHKAWADLEEAELNIWNFVAFYYRYAQEHLPHTKVESRRGRYSSYYNYGGWNDDADDRWADYSATLRSGGKRTGSFTGGDYPVTRWKEKSPGKFTLVTEETETDLAEEAEKVAVAQGWEQCPYCTEVWPISEFVESADGKVCKTCASYFLTYAQDSDRYEYTVDVGKIAHTGEYYTHLFLRSNGFLKIGDDYYHQSECYWDGNEWQLI